MSDPSSRRSYDLGLALQKKGNGLSRTHCNRFIQLMGQSLWPTLYQWWKTSYPSVSPSMCLFERILRNFTHMGVPKADGQKADFGNNSESGRTMTGGRVPIKYPCPLSCPNAREATGYCLCMLPVSGKGHGRGRGNHWTEYPSQSEIRFHFEIPLGGLGIHNFYLRFWSHQQFCLILYTS